MIDRIRKRKRGVVGLLDNDEICDKQDSPELSVENREMVDDFQYCLEQLAPDYHAVVSRFFLGEDHATIAEGLGIAVGTSHSRFARARSSLKDCMQFKGWTMEGDCP